MKGETSGVHYFLDDTEVGTKADTKDPYDVSPRSCPTLWHSVVQSAMVVQEEPTASALLLQDGVSKFLRNADNHILQRDVLWISKPQFKINLKPNIMRELHDIFRNRESTCMVETLSNRHAWTTNHKTRHVSSGSYMGGPSGEMGHSNCGISWSLEATERLSTDTQLLTQYLRSGRPGASLNWVHIRSTMHVYTRESSWKPNSNRSEPDRPHYDSPAACVIAQDYSSATFLSFRFNFRKEKLGGRFKIVTLHFLFYYF